MHYIYVLIKHQYIISETVVQWTTFCRSAQTVTGSRPAKFQLFFFFFFYISSQFNIVLILKLLILHVSVLPNFYALALHISKTE